MLIPSGKIHKSYLKFLSGVCFGNFICGVTSVCSTHGMLGSLIENDQTTDVATVSFNLITKDIVGQMASLPFITSISKLGDKNPKKHLAISLAIYEISNLLECATPLFNSNYFVPIASVGNIGKNIGFTGYGSFNANCINKLSKDKDNIAEIYSRICTSSSICFSLGMICGLYVVKIIPDHEMRMGILPILGLVRYSVISYCSKEIFQDTFSNEMYR